MNFAKFLRTAFFDRAPPVVASVSAISYYCIQNFSEKIYRFYGSKYVNPKNTRKKSLILSQGRHSITKRNLLIL